jgi:hypothetical protein
MKFESRTLQILKNFSTLNPALQFKEGSVISTVTPLKTVMAKAQIKENIPATFAIYELSKFLNVLSLFDNPSINLGDKFLQIGDGKQSVQYTFANPENIVTPGNKEIQLPGIDVKFKLMSSVLQSVLKAMAVLNLPEIAVTGKNGELFVEAINVKNPSSDKFSIKVDTDENFHIDANATFSMIFLADNMKIIPDDYVVSISSRGIAHFKGRDIEYWIATESSSSYSKQQ